MTTSLATFVSPLHQLGNLRRWNDERGWDLPESAFEAVDVTAVTRGSPFVVDVLAVYLPSTGAVTGVQRTCEQLWDIASQRQPRSWCWDERKVGPKPVRLLHGGGDGDEHEPGIRRVTVDLAAHWDRRAGVRPLDVRGERSASAEILAAAAHFPEWVRSMDGDRVPFVCLAGYQVTVPVYETWRHVVCLSWSHFNRRINLSDNWADYFQDRFASPVLVGPSAAADHRSMK
jgi:hypothetical protein